MGFLVANNVLSIDGLSCVRGERVLFKNQTFSVKSGGLLYVQGNNGAGKTTLLRTICGLFQAQAGSVHWNDQETKALAEDYLGQVLYIGHLTGMKEELTAVENLQFTVALKGIHVSREQVLKALNQLGVEHCADLPTRVLSQGQKKRVTLARLWLEKSALWVLDEPFTSLDIHVIEVLTEWIEHYVKEGGVVVMTSHQLPKFDPVIVQHLRLH
jgi:heme exporter protein A